MVDDQTFVEEVQAMERTLYRVARSYLPGWELCADAWNGDILPLDEWLAGRQAIMLYLPVMSIHGEPAYSASWDWVENEQGKTLLVQADAEDMTHETALIIRLHSIIVGTDAAENAMLTVTLPAMTREGNKP